MDRPQSNPLEPPSLAINSTSYASASSSSNSSVEPSNLHHVDLPHATDRKSLNLPSTATSHAGSASGSSPATNDAASKIRKRKTRACDQCNHRRIKCQNAQGTSESCGPCIRGNLACTYLKEPQHRGPKRKKFGSGKDLQQMSSLRSTSAAPTPIAPSSVSSVVPLPRPSSTTAPKQFVESMPDELTCITSAHRHPTRIGSTGTLSSTAPSHQFTNTHGNHAGRLLSSASDSAKPSDQQSVYDALSLLHNQPNPPTPSSPVTSNAVEGSRSRGALYPPSQPRSHESSHAGLEAPLSQVPRSSQTQSAVPNHHLNPQPDSDHPSHLGGGQAWPDSAMLKFDFGLLSALDFGTDESEIRLDGSFTHTPSSRPQSFPHSSHRISPYHYLTHEPHPMTLDHRQAAFPSAQLQPIHSNASTIPPILGQHTSPFLGPSNNNLNVHSMPSDQQVANAISAYFDRFHPMMPVLDHRFVKDIQAQEHRKSMPTAQLTLSLVAMVETAEILERGSGLNMEKPGEVEFRAGPFFAEARKIYFCPGHNQPVSLYQIIAVMHIFVAEDMVGNRKAAWYRLQEAITLAQVLELDRFAVVGDQLAIENDQAALDGLRVFCMLFICERATAMLQKLPSRIPRPLRFADNATQAWLNRSPPSSAAVRDPLADFPMHHLRIFSLVNSQVLDCWHGNCSNAQNKCRAWSTESASKLQKDLSIEFETALKNYQELRGADGSSIGSQNGIQHVNLVVTVAWLRDRFWNICRVHGLVRNEAGSELSPTAPFRILRELVDLFDLLKSTETDPGLDWAAKIYDMAMTAIHSVSEEQLVLSPQSVSAPASSNIQQEMMTRMLSSGVLSSSQYKHAQDKLLPDFLKALALIT